MTWNGQLATSIQSAPFTNAVSLAPLSGTSAFIAPSRSTRSNVPAIVPRTRVQDKGLIQCSANLRDVVESCRLPQLKPNTPQKEPKDSAPPNSPTSRPLTGNERFYYDSAENRDGWGTSALCLRVKADAPDVAMIESALEQLLQKHTGLLAHIKPASHIFQQPQWILGDTPKKLPYTLTKTRHADAWQKELNQLITTKIDPSKEALVKFKLLYNPTEKTCDILLGFHHALMDGMGAWHLMQAFTQTCWSKNHENAPEQAPESTDGFFDREQKKLPDEITGGHQAAMHKAGASAFFDSVKNSIAKLNPAVSTEQTKDKADTATSIHYSRKLLAGSTVKSLITACRAHDTNINGALTALAINTSRDLFKSYWPGFTPIQYITPISLRNSMPDWPAEDLGVCIATSNQVQVIPSTGPKDFWKQAQDCKNNLHGAIASGSPAATFHLLDHLEVPFAPEPLAFAHMPKNYILVNNLGKLPTPATKGHYEYDALSWATHQGPESAIAQFYIASVGDKLSLTVQSNRLSKDQVDQLSNEMERQLNALITSNN